MKDPLDIEIKAKGLTTEKIEHALIEVKEDDKFSCLET